MKTLNIIILCIIFFTSCNEDTKIVTFQPSPEKSKTLIVKLADSLGNVNITLPLRYDTSCTWTHYSDCGKPCEKVKYRFQPKSVPIQMESGFFTDERKDSIDRFTIIHSGYFPFNTNKDSLFIFKVHEKLKLDFSKIPAIRGNIKWDTVEKIGNRYFSIVAVESFDSTTLQYSKQLFGASTIMGNGISFDFELLTKEESKTTDSFIVNSLYFLRTIRLSTEQ